MFQHLCFDSFLRGLHANIELKIRAEHCKIFFILCLYEPSVASVVTRTALLEQYGVNVHNDIYDIEYTCQVNFDCDFARNRVF